MTVLPVVGSVLTATVRIAASLTLFVVAAGIGILTSVVGMVIAGDIDYEEHPLSDVGRWMLMGHLGLAFVCLLASVVPALEDPLPRPAWLFVLALVGACLVGCVIVVILDVVPGEGFRELGLLGILACLVCLWRLATELRPEPHLVPGR